MKATRREMDRANAWIGKHLHGASSPFSFVYNGHASSELLPNWGGDVSVAAENGAQRQTIVKFLDPKTGLETRCEATAFNNFPAVEWVVYFKNTSAADSAIIADIQPLDLGFPAAASETCILHHARGSDCRIDDFQPLDTPMDVSADALLAAYAGRSSNQTLPFFNVEIGDSGVIGAIGWTGGWAARFHRSDTELRARAGMHKTHLRLHPGEEIRTARILLLFWEKDRNHGHNMLRQFVLAHHSPRIDGKIVTPPISYGIWGKLLADEQIAQGRWWAEHDMPMEDMWVDAGWYGVADFDVNAPLNASDWYPQAGNWFPNKQTHPNGLGPVGKAFKDMGYGFILWVEPERARIDTAIVRDHPEFLLGPIGDNHLYNLGMPEAREYLTDLISNILTEAHATCYRQDFNIEPYAFWDAADAPDRVGITETRHIEGLYAMWDALLERHHGLKIDNCASGGRRIDLEMMGRSIPLWRSDYQCAPMDVAGMQGQTFGLAPWVPLSTGSVHRANDYEFRSALGPGIVVNIGVYFKQPNKDIPVEWLRKALQQQVEMRKFFFGDFYPLTPYSLAHTDWMAWQFDLPDEGQGMVQAFSRPECENSRRFQLHGLDPKAQYAVTNADTEEKRQLTGASLMNEGLDIQVAAAPGAALLTYRRL